MLTCKEIDDVIETCLMTPIKGDPSTAGAVWGAPLLLTGEPGASKSARIEQLSEALDLTMEPIFAAQHPPEDFSGALIPMGNGDAKQVCPLMQLRKLMERGRGILLLDEINGASPATQGAIQSLIHERIAGDQRISPEIRMIAAKNADDIATGGMALSAPLANRFVHVDMPIPTPQEWAAWLMGGRQQRPKATDLEQKVRQGWQSAYSARAGSFAGFVQHNPALLHKRPAIGSPDLGKAWPSPRTWDFCIRVLSSAEILGKNDEVKAELAAGCVGPGAAAELLEYLRKTDLPSPLDVLQGKWKLNKHRIDIVLAAYTGMVSYIITADSASKEALATDGWARLFDLTSTGLADITVPAAKALLDHKLGVTGAKTKKLKESAAKMLTWLRQNNFDGI